MLYIFQVDTGQMLCFEMDCAISTVHNLKSTIQSTYGIPIDKQVLLVSGGEILESGSRVCNYAAGTDTNPIFLFNKLNIEGGGGIGGNALLGNNELAAGVSVNEGAGGNSGSNNVQMADQETINRQIDQANSLPPTYMSVVTRAQLAQHIYEMGKEITRKCEVLIHHQHLQHQGWAAVVANLDDIVQLFNAKLQAFVGAYEGFCAEYSKERIDAFVDNLDPTLKTLDTIKLPNPSSNASTPHPSPISIVSWLATHYATSSTPSQQPPSSPTAATTHSQQTPLHTYLHSIAQTTRKTYDHITSPNFLQNLQQDSIAVSEKASSPNMKEINGLEQRLYGLDQLLDQAKHLVVDQHELTQAFHQNVQRASEQRDSSIFPDLCASHQHQLLVMQKNHGQLEDIRRRCGRAKEELTANLNTRLKWVAFVQKGLSEAGGKIGVFHESLKRLRVNLNVLEQVHDCEAVFHAYLTEGKVRGRLYKKLSKLVVSMGEYNGVVERENSRREAFRAKYAGHFLSQAFAVLVEDKRIDKVAIPGLVEYQVEPGSDLDGHDDDDEEHAQQQQPVVDAEKLALQARVKELESTNGGLRDRVTSLESQVADKQKAKKLELESYAVLQQRHDQLSAKFESESGKTANLLLQVERLKKLLDEFRVKEDESIRLHETETREFEARIGEERSKCEERVLELRRMLEFECAQKVKSVEEAHRMEFDAMVKRFKMVNRSVQGGGGFGGSSERIRAESAGNNCGSLGGGLGSKNLECSSDDGGVEDDDLEGEETQHHHQQQQHRIVERDDDEGGMGVMDRSSLERAVDVAACMEMSEVGGGSQGNHYTHTFVDDERVLQAAQRLHKLSRISISTCRVGSDSNLFYFNDKFNAFTVYLNNKNVHFLNSSDKAPGAEELRGLKTTQMFIANITDKEFCVARRSQNRYNVPQGFHFYRVKCKVVEVLDE